MSDTPQEPNIIRMKLRDALAQGIIKPDPRNANLSSERGHYMIDQSIRKLGLGRGIVLDKDGYIPAGNQTVEIASQALDDAEVIIVETDGNQLVATRRVDFDLMDAQGAARQYSIADNRASEVSLTWNTDELQAYLDAGVDLGDWFKSDELDALLASDTIPDDIVPSYSDVKEKDLLGEVFIEIACNKSGLELLKPILEVLKSEHDATINIS